MKRLILLAALVALPFAALADDERLPLEHFVQLPEYNEVSLSPDGRHLAITAPVDDQTGVVILDISDPESVSIAGGFQLSANEHASNVVWANNERILFGTNRQEGRLAQPRPTGRIYGVNVDGSRSRMLYGTDPGSRVFRMGTVLSTLPDEEHRVLILTRAHDSDRPTAQRLHIHTGSTRRVAISPIPFGSLVADQQGRVRLAFGPDEDGQATFAYRDDHGEEWQDFDLDFDQRWLNFHGFDGSGEHIYFSSRETGRMGLYRIRVEDQSVETLIESDTVEINRVLWSEDRSRVIGAIKRDGKPEMVFIDPDQPTAILQRQISAAFPDEFSRIVSFSQDTDLAIVVAESDITAAGYYLFDTDNLAASFLLSNFRELDPQRLYRTEPIQVESRDGLELHGYLTTPAGEGPHPTVVVVHGGPHGIRDEWTFNPEIQLLAHHGYAVLSVNFRGSGGYGHEFETMGYRNWGTTMQDDVTDATLWAIEEGHADPDRVCIMGGSYGGYSTLMGLIREPELYACGVSVVGVYDLPLMFEEGDVTESSQGIRTLERYLGTDEEDLIARSPARQVEKIEAPLYISHGGQDVRAHISHYNFLKEQLDEAGIEYESRLFPEEGHGYYKVENRKLYYGDVLDFLKRHIGE
ncbi:S9 family peptidase [Gammaproteobacteria bacterium AB-CW1]|uniref:S9 family peptidase n=1 Tax=Natronospira elongata TaxID=3110268 RepID=A0AAP6JHQ6_9GAMM|nr:S9 family peptidase [Gammaproteobacteria bacterium AB-CW1]